MWYTTIPSRYVFVWHAVAVSQPREHDSPHLPPTMNEQDELIHRKITDRQTDRQVYRQTGSHLH